MLYVRWIERQGNFGHAGRPGLRGGSAPAEFYGTDEVLKSIESDMYSFNIQSSRWTGGSDVDAREIAFQSAIDNKNLHYVLLEMQFKKPVSKLPITTTLYRVGRPAQDGISSFFTKKAAAVNYGKRMGVESVDRYAAKTMKIVPSLAGSGEVWVRSEDVID